MKHHNEQKKKIQRILIMAGGTGGHVFPGLVVANYFRNQQIEVHWLGTSQGLEARLVPEAHFPLHPISIQGLRGKGWKSWAMAPLKVIVAIMQSKKIIQQLKPDLVLGMGGFVSGPGGIASWLSNCPLIIHEQNAIAGLTNKVLARFASQVLQGFPHAFRPHRKVKVIGNPVRPEIELFSPPDQRFDTASSSKRLRLLVLGGSLGAQTINQLLPEVLAKLPREERPLVIHQTGEKHFQQTLQAYQTYHLNVHTDDHHHIEAEIQVLPFIKDMVSAYAFADMVLCRAGAVTLAELCMVGVASILVPFPYAVDDHQTANAEFMVSKGASICIQQSALTTDYLIEQFKYFTKLPEKRLSMARAAYQLRQVQVAEDIFKTCYAQTCYAQ